jgi:hypothetical protein
VREPVKNPQIAQIFLRLPGLDTAVLPGLDRR